MFCEQSNADSLSSEVHHKAVPDMLTGDADGHKIVLDCLGRAAFRARNSKKSPASVHEKVSVDSLIQKVKALSHEGNRALQGPVMAENKTAILREEEEAGARAVEDFPQVLIKAIPTLVEVTSSALGAIVSLKPRTD